MMLFSPPRGRFDIRNKPRMRDPIKQTVGEAVKIIVRGGPA
jgi:hypothetical protein